MTCSKDHPHQLLQGRLPGSNVLRTAAAQKYSKAFCSRYSSDVKRFVRDVHKSAYPIEEAEEVSSDEELVSWLQQKRLDFDDLRYFATKSERVQRWQQRQYGQEAEIRFLERKLELDRVVYSLIRVSSQELAEEFYHRLKAGEADFPELALNYSEGQEKNTRGLIGPVPLAAGHPELANKLRISRPGQLWPPFLVVDVWLVLRFERLLPAKLDNEMRRRMIEELFQVWFRDRVQLLIDGEPLPPLPYLPPDNKLSDAKPAPSAS
jgi:hypothetical protein